MNLKLASLFVYLLSMAVAPPLAAEGWTIDESLSFGTIFPESGNDEAIRKAVDEIRIYKQPAKDRRWDRVFAMLDREPDYRTMDRREIEALLDGMRDNNVMGPSDFCYRRNGVWTFHTVVLDYELKRLGYVQITECAPKPGMPRSRDAGVINPYSAENTISASSRSIIRIMRELGVPGTIP